MTDQERELCACAYPRRDTPWHCACGRWKPAAATLCDVCQAADAITESWAHQLAEHA